MKKIFLSVLVILVGVGLLVFSYFRITDYNEKNKKYVETEAVVIGHTARGDDQEAIIVEYEVDGKKYTSTSDTSTNHPKSVGTKVKIKYNPENPEQMIWSNDITNIAVPIIGLVFTGLGIYCVYENINTMNKMKKGNEA